MKSADSNASGKTTRAGAGGGGGIARVTAGDFGRESDAHAARTRIAAARPRRHARICALGVCLLGNWYPRLGCGAFIQFYHSYPIAEDQTGELYARGRLERVRSDRSS